MGLFFREHIRRKLIRALPRFLVCVSVTLLLFWIMTVLSRTLNVVTVTDTDGNSEVLLTAEKDPEALMDLAGITAGTADDVFCTRYGGGRTAVMIQRPYPVTVCADGGTDTVYLTHGTVKDAMSKAGAVLNEHDYTEPSGNTEMREGDSAQIHRVEYVDVVTQETIDPQTVYETTSLLYRYPWYSVVEQEGSAGVRETTTRTRVVDGVTESGEVVSVADTVAPVDTVILEYSADAPVSPLSLPAGVTVTNGVPSSYRAVYTGRGTGYSSNGGSGASGLGLFVGTVAVNPNLIPYGSLLYIVSADGSFTYGVAVATDTGSALVQNMAIVDLYFASTEDALLFASLPVVVYVF